MEDPEGKLGAQPPIFLPALQPWFCAHSLFPAAWCPSQPAGRKKPGGDPAHASSVFLCWCTCSRRSCLPDLKCQSEFPPHRVWTGHLCWSYIPAVSPQVFTVASFITAALLTGKAPNSHSILCCQKHLPGGTVPSTELRVMGFVFVLVIFHPKCFL